MKLLLGSMLFLAAAGGYAAEAYRWVDEKGVVNYGEKPPAGRHAVPVNTIPGGIVETDGRFSRKPPVAPPAGERPGAPVPAAVAPAAPARGMEFDVYIRLQRGMTEGELLLRAGRPDHETIDSFRPNIVKTYYYFPTTSNPYTTVVTLHGGRIFEVDRVRKF